MEPYNVDIIKFMEGKETFSESNNGNRKWKFDIHHEDIDKMSINAVEVDITFIPVQDGTDNFSESVSGPHHKKIVEVDGHLRIVSPDNESLVDFIIDQQKVPDHEDRKLILTRLEWGTGKPRENIVLN